MTITNSASAPALHARTIGAAALRPPAGMQAPAGVVLIPSEEVLLLAVDLPVMAASQRRSAVGFAVEDQIAQTLDEVTVVLGPQLSPGVWLVAVTARSVLAEAGLAKTGDGRAALWPDVLLLPVPLAGWAVWAGADRAVVRLPDGTGFATSFAALPAFWAAAGSPAITAFGGILPEGIPATARAELPGVDLALTGFDLRAGLNRAAGLSLPKGARPLLLVLLVAALAHLTLLLIDVVALNRLAGQGEDDLRALLNAPDSVDLDVAVAQALAARQPADTAGVLSLLTRAFAAIGAQSGRVSVQDLRYTAADDTAVLTLEAPDLATLQAVETALTGAGLSVTAGAATTRDGAAEVQMTLGGGGA